MNTSNTNIQKHMAFVTAVSCGSFTEAANILGYSQSGISRMIRDLETEWGVILLERGKSGVILTSEGEQLLPYVRRLCNEYDSLKNEVSSMNDLQKGLIRIGTISSAAAHLLPGLIRGFRNLYPGIGFEFLFGDYSEIEAWIREGAVDCGITCVQKETSFDIIPLIRDEWMAVLPEDNPLAKKKKVDLKALCDYPFIMIKRDTYVEIDELFKKEGLDPDIRFTSFDDNSIMAMVECGLGVSILPELVLHRTPYNIVKASLDEPIGRDIVLAMRKRDEASSAAKRFAEYIEKNRG